MVTSPLDKPPYTPLFPPPVGDIDLQQVENWVKQELDTIARYATAQPGTLFTPGNAIPARPRTGILTYADGVNWNPGYGEGLYVYKQGVWTPVGVGVGSRIRLSTATSFFFDTGAGNDNNPGTSALPWATPAPLGQRYDTGGQNVTLTLKNNATTKIQVPSWVGGGNVALDLNGHTVINSSDTAVHPLGVPIGSILTVKNGTVAGTGSNQASGIYHDGGGQVQLGDTTGATTLIVGACSFCGLVATGLGGGQPSMNVVGPISFSGAASGQLSLMFAAASATFTTGFLNGNQLIQATGNLANAAITAFANFALFSFQGSLAFHKNAHTVPATDTAIAAPASMGAFPGWA